MPWHNCLPLMFTCPAHALCWFFFYGFSPAGISCEVMLQHRRTCMILPEDHTVQKSLTVIANQVVLWSVGVLTTHNQYIAGVIPSSSSNPLQQYPQPGSLQHHQPLQQQQQQQQPSLLAASSASQPPAGASFLPPSSSTFLAGTQFGGNSGGGSVGIHLPLGVSHVDPDGYLTSPGQSGLVNPIQTGMATGLANPSHSGLSDAHQLAFGKPVQTGMSDPHQPAGLYHKPSSAQAGRQDMQVTL